MHRRPTTSRRRAAFVWLAAASTVGAALAAGGPRSADAAPEPIRSLRGVVFVDYDRDGRIDPGELGEAAAAGLDVTAIDALGRGVRTVTADDGTFELSLDRTEGSAFRVEFATPDGFVPTFAQPLGRSVSASQGPVRHIDVASDRPPIGSSERGEVLYGIVPDVRCPAAPSVSAPTQLLGAASFPGTVWTSCLFAGAVGDEPAVVATNGRATGWTPADGDADVGLSAELTTHGTTAEVGATWGLAYDEWDRALYATAFVKRHAELGPAGIDGLYRLLFSDDDQSVWTTFGLDSLSPPGAPSFGDDPVECPVDGDGYAYARFTAEASARGGPWDCRDIARSDDRTSHDWWAFDRTGREGVGGIDVTPDGDRLLVVNATADTLFVYDIADGAPRHLAHHTVDDPGCDAGDLELWAVTAIDATAAYVGVTCTATTSQDAGDLAAHVVRIGLDDGEQATVVSLPLDYPHGAGWTAQPGPTGGAFRPWLASDDGVPRLPDVADVADVQFVEEVGAYAYVSTWSAPQPLLTDLAIDPFDGSLILGVADRWAMMTGVFNCDLEPLPGGCGVEFPAPPPGDYDGDGAEDPVSNYTAGFTAYAAGDVLRACNVGGSVDEPEFAVEGDVRCTTPPGSPEFDPPFGGGPAGTTEWYWGDQAFGDTVTDSAHPEAVQGSLYVPARSHEVVASANNPAATFGAGLAWISSDDGGFHRGVQLYRTDVAAPDGRGYNSYGLGDVEGCFVPLEVATTVWFDVDKDGVRDPGEPPMIGVEVDLYDTSVEPEVRLATRRTNAEGVVHFGSADGVRAGSDVELDVRHVTMDNTDVLPAGIDPIDLIQTEPDADDDDRIDSDLDDGRIRIRTGRPGVNDSSYGAGYFTNVLAITEVPQVDDSGASTAIRNTALVGAGLLTVILLLAALLQRKGDGEAA